MSGDLLKRLAEAGTPMDLIMEVAETLAEAKAAEKLLEKRREKDRERKRISAVSAESQESSERAEVVPNEYISNPPTPSETKVSSGVSRPTKSKNGSRLADDFEAPADWIDWAIERRGWSRPDATAEAEKFCRHWKTKTGKDATKRDWFMTWQNWVDGSFRPDGPHRNDPAKPFDRAEYEARLEKIGRQESTGPPRAVGDLASKILAGVPH